MTHLAAVETGSRLWSRSVTWSHVPLSHHGTLRLWEPSEGKLRLPAHHWVKRIEHWLWAIRRSLKACLLLLFFLLIFLRLLLALIFLFEGLGQIFICQISCKHKKCVGYRSFCKLWLLSLSYTFHIESHVCCLSLRPLWGWRSYLSWPCPLPWSVLPILRSFRLSFLSYLLSGIPEFPSPDPLLVGSTYQRAPVARKNQFSL